MGNHDDRPIGSLQSVDALRDSPGSASDVETAVGLIEDSQLRLQDRHLEDFVALFLSAGKADIDRPLQQIVTDIEQFQFAAHQSQKLAGVELWLAAGGGRH